MNQIIAMMRFLNREEVYEWASDEELLEAGQEHPSGWSHRYKIGSASTTKSYYLNFETFEQWSDLPTSTEVESIPPAVLKRIHERLYTACKTAMMPTAIAMLVRGELQKIGITGKLDE